MSDNFQKLDWHGIGEYGEGLQHAWIGSGPIMLDSKFDRKSIPVYTIKSFCGIEPEYKDPGKQIWFSVSRETNEPMQLECPECRIEVDKFRKHMKDIHNAANT